MNALNREFTLRERVLFIILGLILVAMVYYYFVDQPVRTALQTASSEYDTLQIELTAASAKLNKLQRMQSELDTIDESQGFMQSYNGIKAETLFLNDVMESTDDYSLTFSNVTRDGDQIRRNVSLQFTSETYEDAVSILEQIAESKYRCKIGDVSCSRTDLKSSDVSYGYYVNGKYITTVVAKGETVKDDLTNGKVRVTCTVTFYETMVGGTEDSGLPKSEDAEVYYDE